MAGTIAVSADRRWSAAGWLFDWTVEFLADRVADAGLKAELREIVTENLGWLGLSEHGAEAEREMRALLQDEVVSAAEAGLPAIVAHREGALALLRELAGAVA